VLASAVSRSLDDGVAIAEALQCAAQERGRSIATSFGATASSNDASPGPLQQTGAALDVLAAAGYEPRSEAGEVVLVNCPFHRLARDHPDLVCGMNLTLLDSLLEALGASGLEARLDPEPPLCCVKLRRTDVAESSRGGQ
jgi:predicted ArsR family transcriptional regulator